MTQAYKHWNISIWCLNGHVILEMLSIFVYTTCRRYGENAQAVAASDAEFVVGMYDCVALVPMRREGAARLYSADEFECRGQAQHDTLEVARHGREISHIYLNNNKKWIHIGLIIIKQSWYFFAVSSNTEYFCSPIVVHFKSKHKSHTKTKMPLKAF